ncbi:hypothetical protein CAPTEDRAFT_24483, partial [Capitella teleta]
RLNKKLLTNYDTNVRPVLNHSHPVEVQLALTIQNIIDLDEESDVLTMYTWVSYLWTDEYLNWNESEYGGIKSIRFRDDQIWHPDIHLYNKRSYEPIDTFMIVYSSGTVSFVSPMVMKSNCAVDISNFPFDNQTCILTFGSWTYDGSKVSLKSVAPPGLHTYTMNNEFELTNATHKVNWKQYQCCPEPYVDVTYTLELKRRTDHATHFIMSPCIICSLLIPFIFLLPHGTNDKILYGAPPDILHNVFLI